MYISYYTDIMISVHRLISEASEISILYVVADYWQIIIDAI